MSQKSVLRVATPLIAVTLACAGCNLLNPLAPSSVASEGYIDLGVFQTAVVNFKVERPQRYLGDWVSMVDWQDRTNDVDSALFRGRCTLDQVLTETTECSAAAAIAIDSSRNKPSYLSPSMQPGDHTLVFFNFGPRKDKGFYHIEGAVEATLTTLPRKLLALFRRGAKRDVRGERRTDTFTFTLPAGCLDCVVRVGPVNAGDGSVTVTLAYANGSGPVGTRFVILACVGTVSACTVFGGGSPSSATFNIPADYPAGPIQASVYFNSNAPQPPGDASGTVSFTYDPL